MTITAHRKKVPTHVKKRSGDHHQKSKAYTKTYWPYLPMLMVIGIGLFLNLFWSNTGHVLGIQSSFTAAELLADTNADRLAENENPLTLNNELMTAAQNKATSMATQNYWSHDTPEGQTPWSFITAAGYTYQAAGENLAYGFNTGADVETGWMDSPDHRANVLNAAYTNVGFGVASSPNYQHSGPAVIVVAMYAEPAGGINVDLIVPPHQTTNPTAAVTQPPSRPISGLQLISSTTAPWVITAAALTIGAALAALIIRHALGCKRLIMEGEILVTRHPFFDTLIVAIIVVGLLLGRTAGFVR